MPAPVAKSLAENLKAAMRHYPQGVTIVTIPSEKNPIGITVGTFTSISLTPPLVIISIAKGTNYHDLYVNSKAFAINILASDQADISERFAGKIPLGEERFHHVPHHNGSLGAPLIDHALSWIECRAWKTIDAGDHTIILGEVTECTTPRDSTPLLYYNRQYTTTSPLEPLAHDYEVLFMGW